MNFNNILGASEDNDTLNTILIILIILIIIFSFGRNGQQVCGYTFGCFNPANLLPTGVSPEQFERNDRKHNKCCEPCCRPYQQPCGPFGGNFLWILAAIAFFLFCFKDDKHDDDECCC